MTSAMPRSIDRHDHQPDVAVRAIKVRSIIVVARSSADDINADAGVVDQNDIVAMLAPVSVRRRVRRRSVVALVNAAAKQCREYPNNGVTAGEQLRHGRAPSKLTRVIGQRVTKNG